MIDQNNAFCAGDETGLETYIPPKILLLDDDARFLNKISEGVEKAIFKLQTALDLSTGLLYACNEPYDAVLVNYEMLQTKDDRISFLEDVKGLPGYKNIPISVILPVKVDEEKEQLLRKQFSSVLVRTADIKEIAHHLLSLISGSFDRYSGLIVSHSQSSSQSLGNRMSKAGFQIESTDAPDRAVDLIYSQQPDVVLIDRNCPGGDVLQQHIRSSLRLQNQIIALFDESPARPKTVSMADLLLDLNEPDGKLFSVLKNTASESRDWQRSEGTDPLSGLPKRNKLLQYLIPRLHFRNSAEHKLDVVAFDVQAMAELNRKYGYHIGDGIIRRLSTYLQQSFPHQYVYSWGNDDFIIVGDGSDPNFTNRIQHAHANFESLKFENVHEPLRLNLGTAHYPQDSKTATGLISTALHQLKLQPSKAR